MMNIDDERKEALRTDLQQKCGVYFYGDEIDVMLKVISVYVEPKKSFSKAIEQNKEEESLDDPHFKGEAYEKEIDQKALKHGFFKVFIFMCSNPGWHTDVEIAEATGVYVPSVQRYRSYMRSVEWGSHKVEHQRRKGMRTFEYQLIPNKDSLTYAAYLKLTSL